jgi:hypothetical protein
MLTQICIALDRANEFAAVIERDGAVFRTKGSVRDHPLIRHEVALRSFVVRSLGRLNLDVIPARTEAGRPSGGGAYRGESR